VEVFRDGIHAFLTGLVAPSVAFTLNLCDLNVPSVFCGGGIGQGSITQGHSFSSRQGGQYLNLFPEASLNVQVLARVKTTNSLIAATSKDAERSPGGQE